MMRWKGVLAAAVLVALALPAWAQQPVVDIVVRQETAATNTNTANIATTLNAAVGAIGNFTGLTNAVGVIFLDKDTGGPQTQSLDYGLNLPYDLSGAGPATRWRADNDGQCTPVGGDDYFVAPCASRGGALWAGLSVAGTAIGATGTSLNVSVTNLLPASSTLASGVVSSAMTGTTSTSVIAGTASNYIYVTNCTPSNASLTVSTDILLQDGSGGTTLYVIPAPAAAVATTGGGGSTIVFPAPLKVPTAGNALYAANVTTGSSTKISCSGFKSTVSY